MSIYTDDKFAHIESDIEKIQVKPNMYISYSGSDGSLHLFKEGINNSIDECINPNSDGNIISIKVFLDENAILLNDNGRGIPEDVLETVCTKLQSGSKFVRATSLGSAGENGCGLTAMNALSEKFILITRRYKKILMLEFEEGNKVKETTDYKDAKKYIDFNKNVNGVSIYFKPSQKFLGDCNFEIEKVKDWIEDIQFMLPNYITIHFTIYQSENNPIFKTTYKNDLGMSSVLDKILKEKVLDKNIRLSNFTHMDEEVIDYEDGSQNKKNVERFVGIEFAFNYDNNSENEEDVISFCNFVKTIDHGVHAESVRSAITSYLSKQAKASLSEKEAKKFDIVIGDVTQGLKIALYLSTDHQVHFASQTKEKVANKELVKPIKDMVSDRLKEYFRGEPNILKQLVNVIKTNAKLRIALLNAKKSVVKDIVRGSIKDYAEEQYVPANNKGKNDYRELIIIEGKSAGSLTKMGRYDPDTQALFFARGVPLNTKDLTIDEVLKNKEFRLLVEKLGCNIGTKFDINNLYFDKIIIMTDSDIDGEGIASFLLVFFFTHMPELIYAGKIFRLVIPLYKVQDKKNPFLLDKKDLYLAFANNINKHVKISNMQGRLYTKEDVFRFLEINYSLNKVINDFATHEGLDYTLVEFLLQNMDNLTYKKLTKILPDKFPQMSVFTEDGYVVLDGVIHAHNRKSLTKAFIKELKEIHKQYSLNKDYFLNMEIDNYNYPEGLFITEIMNELSRFEPVIITRFKGVGEFSDPKELEDVAMNPNNRRLIRIILDDEERTNTLFNILFSSANNKIREARKEKVKTYKLEKDELDN